MYNLVLYVTFHDLKPQCDNQSPTSDNYFFFGGCRISHRQRIQPPPSVVVRGHGCRYWGFNDNSIISVFTSQTKHYRHHSPILLTNNLPVFS